MAGDDDRWGWVKARLESHDKSISEMTSSLSIISDAIPRIETKLEGVVTKEDYYRNGLSNAREEITDIKHKKTKQESSLKKWLTPLNVIWVVLAILGFLGISLQVHSSDAVSKKEVRVAVKKVLERNGFPCKAEEKNE